MKEKQAVKQIGDVAVQGSSAVHLPTGRERLEDELQEIFANLSGVFNVLFAYSGGAVDGDDLEPET